VRSLFLQIRAVTAINLKSLPDRLWSSLSTVFALALTVVVLLGFLALGTGIARTLAGTGSERVALVMRQSSPDESASMLDREAIPLIEEAPQVVRRGGVSVASPERFVIVKAERRTGDFVNVSLRGVGPAGLQVRPGAHVVQGRMFMPGSDEMIVGRAMQREFRGFELGKPVLVGNATWKVVGVFEQSGSVNESEALVSIETLQNFYRAGATYQSERVLLTGPNALAGLNHYLNADPRLDVEAISERSYFAKQANGVASLLRALAWPLAIAMAVGALIGALNTMYSSVAERTTEVATLRAIGFSPVSAFAGTLVESVALAVAGAIAGAVLAFLIFNGLRTSTVGANFTQIVFTFRLDRNDYMSAVVLALAVGVTGGILPAWRAARISPARVAEA
jgi:putative ABC transport system permease protein